MIVGVSCVAARFRLNVDCQGTMLVNYDSIITFSDFIMDEYKNSTKCETKSNAASNNSNALTLVFITIITTIIVIL